MSKIEMRTTRIQESIIRAMTRAKGLSSKVLKRYKNKPALLGSQTFFLPLFGNIDCMLVTTKPTTEPYGIGY